MHRAHLCLFVSVALLTLPACGKRGPAPAPADPEPDAAVPPPRELALAAEPAEPKGALELVVVRDAEGAWKAQYASGQRVTLGDAPLVLPVGRPVTLAVFSASGTASFAVYRFNVAVEAAPNKPGAATVKPTRTGDVPIRSGPERVGTVRVVPAAEFDAWLAGQFSAPHAVDGTAVAKGRTLFLKLQCINCHTGQAGAKGPTLEGLYGAKVALKGGGFEVADEAYLIESVRNPRAKVVDGWEGKAVMPAYGAEQVTNEELADLTAYLKALKPGGAKPKDQFPPPVGAPAERPPLNDRLKPIQEFGGDVAQPRLEPLRLRPDPRPVAPPPRAK